jgi:hypothetical protein
MRVDRMARKMRVGLALHQLLVLMSFTNVDVVVLDPVDMDNIIVAIRSCKTESLSKAVGLLLGPWVGALNLELVLPVQVAHKFIVLFLLKAVSALPEVMGIWFHGLGK